MKINADRLYTHPVLAEGSDDYRTNIFRAEMNYRIAANNVELAVNFSTDCAEINALIRNGTAEFVLHAECSLTAFRKIFRSSIEQLTCQIPLRLLRKELSLVAFILLRKDVKNFSCADWNADFDGITADLPKGSVLAYKNFERLKIPDEQNFFRNVASIFSVYRKADDDEFFEVKPDSDKIKIGLNANDYLLYRRYSSKPEMQPILNAMIILPALVYIFEELKADALRDFVSYGARAWFLSLKATYRRRKINLEEYVRLEENTSLKLAQEVMQSPLKKALENISLISDAAEDL